MGRRVTVVDYGMGNLASVARALVRIGAEPEVTADPDRVAAAERLILPGVGAFGDAARALRRAALEEPILGHVRRGRPFLGICLGLQLAFESSEEEEGVPGLGILPGRVVRFRFPAGGPKVPHMGWNRVLFERPHPFLGALTPAAGDGGVPPLFYFVHSFYPVPARAGDRLGIAEHGVPFAAAAGREGMLLVQFHPEKSFPAGHEILRAFAEA